MAPMELIGKNSKDAWRKDALLWSTARRGQAPKICPPPWPRWGQVSALVGTGGWVYQPAPLRSETI